jgi:hypothetical protein
VFPSLNREQTQQKAGTDAHVPNPTGMVATTKPAPQKPRALCK